MPVRSPKLFVTLLVCSLWLAACGTGTPTVAVQPTAGVAPGTAYPGISEAYPPVPTNSPLPTAGYPALATTDPSIVPFELDRPIYAGDTIVSGRGPAGVPIVLQDVSFMGEAIAEAVIGSDNRFTLNVPPLEAAHRIGVAVGDLTGTDWTYDVLQSPPYSGPQPMMVPQVGQYMDSVMVTAAP